MTGRPPLSSTPHPKPPGPSAGAERLALPASVTERLDRLTPDQRAAATAPPGPVLCIAPAGSGKTTTLVARIAWLVATGTPARRIAAIAFNKRAADELAERLAAALAPMGVASGTVRVRTFHALGREILQSAGRSVEPLVARSALLRSVLPQLEPADRRRLDTAISRLKLDLRVSVDAVAADPEAGPLARGFVAYARALAKTGGLDFDDLVAEALTALEADPGLLADWRSSCHEVLVDEVQDVDRSQLELALLLSAPANRIFLVGDDDQSIYAWRLADVKREVSRTERVGQESIRISIRRTPASSGSSLSVSTASGRALRTRRHRQPRPRALPLLPPISTAGLVARPGDLVGRPRRTGSLTRAASPSAATRSPSSCGRTS